MRSQIAELPVGNIDPNPKQPRKDFPQDHIERLAASIQKRGLLQPITVKPKGRRFTIIAGECRWRAHVLLKAETISAIILAISDRETQLLSVMENLQRRDMNPIEEGHAFETLMEDGYTVEQVVDELGLKSSSLVRQRLFLVTNLLPALQKLVATGNLSVAMGAGIAQAPVDHQMKLFRDVQSGRLRTIEQVRHASIALRDAAAQVDVFAALPRAGKKDLETLSKLERKIAEVIAFVSAGFKDGECVAAQLVSPDRVLKMADQLALVRKHVALMEHDLRRVATQTAMRLEVA